MYTCITILCTTEVEDHNSFSPSPPSPQSATGFLQYLDVSVGKEVEAICTKAGRLDVMAQNPHNAVIHLGHTNGTVTLWSPNQREPLVKMLCHQGGVRSLAVDKTGT